MDGEERRAPFPEFNKYTMNRVIIKLHDVDNFNSKGIREAIRIGKGRLWYTYMR
jgi:hypothetical protein